MCPVVLVPSSVVGCQVPFALALVADAAGANRDIVADLGDIVTRPGTTSAPFLARLFVAWFALPDLGYFPDVEGGVAPGTRPVMVTLHRLIVYYRRAKFAHDSGSFVSSGASSQASIAASIASQSSSAFLMFNAV